MEAKKPNAARIEIGKIGGAKCFIVEPCYCEPFENPIFSKEKTVFTSRKAVVSYLSKIGVSEELRPFGTASISTGFATKPGFSI